jgi:ABC-type uncharacterized transport system auxiliary subunit
LKINMQFPTRRLTQAAALAMALLLNACASPPPATRYRPLTSTAASSGNSPSSLM